MSTQTTLKLNEIINDFTVGKDFLVKATDKFLEDMDLGLKSREPSRFKMPMIPSFVTEIPSGKEKGLFLAGDLGGTNFRVCSTLLKGDHTFDLIQEKFKIPQDLMQHSTAEKLFSYLAEKVSFFLDDHHPESSGTALKMGFTFSFPVDQTALNRGTLIRWTKGFNLPDAIGKDIVKLFQSHLDLLGLNVTVVALANDTVGTLLSRCYQNVVDVSNARTIVGAIFGTGTNGAYYEKLENIGKLPLENVPKHAKGMVINTEWGSFDNELKVLPRTKYDDIVDSETSNQGYHLFEKRISGMFLGEILRVVLMDLFHQGLVFSDLYKKRGGSLPHRLSESWQLDSEILSYIQIDDSTDLKMSGLILENSLRLPTTKEERYIIQQLTHAISKRAAYLSAIPLAAMVKRVAAQDGNDDKDFEFGCDGSVIEFYPGFQENILKAIDLINPLKGSDKKVHISITKDGSGVGAALSASKT